MALAIGCRQTPREDWGAVYMLAREKADHHDSGAALEMAERGFRQTTFDPVLNYKFRILVAELTAPKDWKRSLELLEIPLPGGISTGEFAARRRLSQSIAHIFEKDLTAADSSLEQAEEIASGSCPQLLARIALTQGYLDDVQGRDRAGQSYRTALGFARRYKQIPLQTDAEVNLGRLLARQEHYDEAIDQLLPALDQVKATNEQLAKEKILGNLGWSYFELGDIDRSISLLQQAGSAAAALNNTEDQENWYTLLGNAYLSQKNYPQAQVYYSRSLSLAESLGDRDLTVLAWHNLAQLALARQQPDKADEYNKRAQLQSQNHSDPFLVLTTAEVAIARKQFPEAAHTLAALLRNPKTESSLRWQAQSDLANVYVAQNRFVDAEREFDTAVQILEKASGDVKQEERRMSILDAWPFYDDYIRFLIDRGKVDKALQIAEFSRARTLSEAFGINAQQRASSLQVPLVRRFLAAQKQIILAYWLADRQSYLWVVTPVSLHIFPLPGKDEIEQAIQSNDRQILEEHTEVGNSTGGQRLYEMLVKPAEELIPKDAHVTIVPHRSLYRVNFESLVVSGPKPHYWIEDVQVENASSIALLTSSRHRPGPPLEGMLLVGAPKEVTREFPALKHAPEEMQKVESHFPIAKVISGDAATPSAYRQSDPERYRMVDFVSHGTASETSPLDSAIILSSDSDSSYKLYAREIKDIPLRADLVTISTCYGNKGRIYSGEGTVGLLWAFMRAGAHQVIGALWEVDETSSPQLMDDFYGELTGGKSSAEALRDAKLKMLHSNTFYRHPYYWASLQLYTGS